GLARLKTASTRPSSATPSLRSALRKRKPGRASRWWWFSGRPVRKLSTDTTCAPSLRRASQRCDPRKPAPPKTTARWPAKRAEASRIRSVAEELVHGRLARELCAILLEDHVDPLADVLGEIGRASCRGAVLM